MATSFEEFSLLFESDNLLRRKSVGIVHAPLGSHNRVVSSLDEAFDLSFVLTNLLDSVTPSNVDLLTASAFCQLCIPEAASKIENPKILIGFDALFSTLRSKAQETVSSRLANAEPEEPLILVIHSPFTKNRLRNDFSERRFLSLV